MDDEIKDINPNNEEKPDGQTEEAPVADDANEEEAQATDGSPTDDTDIFDNPTAGEAHSDYKPVNRFDAAAVHHLSGMYQNWFLDYAS